MAGQLSSADLRVAAVSVLVLCSQFQLNEGQLSPPWDAATECPAFSYPTGNPDATIFRPNPSRLFPLCIQKDPEGKYDPVIKESGFDNIIEDINKRYKDGWTNNYDNFKYKPGQHQWNTKPTQVMQDSVVVHFYRQKVNNVAAGTTVMNNWVHVELYLPRDQVSSGVPGQMAQIEGIYVQAIMGPLGIPFGEFPIFDPTGMKAHGLAAGGYKHRPACNNAPCPESPPEFFKHARNVPCTFFSRAGLSVPQVLLWSNKLPGASGNYFIGDERISFTFRWDENLCAEVSFFQFMVIMVYNFGNKIYHVGLTPLMWAWDAQWDSTGHTFFFHLHGLGYPFYRHWVTEYELEANNGGKHFEMLTDNTTDRTQYRIVSNLEYETCVQHFVGLNRAKSRQWECPPGPFKCDLNARPNDGTRTGRNKHKIADFTYWIQYYKYYNNNLHRPNCTTQIPTTTTTTTTTTTSTTTTPATTTTAIGPVIPTRPPKPPSTTPRPTKADAVVGESNAKTEVTEVAKQISHGDLCVYVWMVQVPISNHIVRYYTDFAVMNWLGLGWFVVLHVLLQHSGILIMWLSFGLVVSNGEVFLGKAGVLHYLFGFPAFALQHWLLFTGHKRSNKLQTAQRQSYIHAGLGYASTFLSVFAATAMHPNSGKSDTVYIMFGVTMIFSLIACLIERRIGRQLGMFPRRRFFPVMERIMMVNTKPRMRKLRIFVGLMYCVILHAVYFLYWVWDHPRFQDILRNTLHIHLE